MDKPALRPRTGGFITVSPTKDFHGLLLSTEVAFNLLYNLRWPTVNQKLY